MSKQSCVIISKCLNQQLTSSSQIQAICDSLSSDESNENKVIVLAENVSVKVKEYSRVMEVHEISTNPENESFSNLRIAKGIDIIIYSDYEIENEYGALIHILNPNALIIVFQSNPNYIQEIRQKITHNFLKNEEETSNEDIGALWNDRQFDILRAPYNIKDRSFFSQRLMSFFRSDINLLSNEFE